jgi:UDP:flavonoid glycosyltransferase YjiC (YdhE family)
VAEILVVTWDGGGNVPPALGIARELAARGHAVRLAGHRTQREALQETGFPVVPVPHAREFSGLADNSPLTMVRTFADRGLARDVTAELEARPADLVVVDCLLLGVLDAVRATRTPYVVLEHMYDASYRTMLRGPIGLGVRASGVRPGRALAGAAARLVTSIPELDPSGSRTDVEHVGPVVPWSARVPGGPAVLVSLSTFAYPGLAACLQRVLDATADLDARVVVTTGPVVDPDMLRTSPVHEVHRFVPHAELMPHVSLVVGHGGHSTTMQALAHDLPLVVVPMHPLVDQPLVGRTVERAGAGRVLPKRSSPRRLREAIDGLLADGPHRAAAARLGEAVRSRPGAQRAADRIEALVRRSPTGVPFGT